MRRSHRGRSSTDNGQRRRLLAVAAALAVFGGLVGVTQISNAESQQAAPGCEPTSSPPSAGASERPGSGGDDDAASPGATETATPPGSDEECAEQEGGTRPPATATATPGGNPPAGGGLDALGNDCKGSDLPAHTGFQDGGRCVSTAFGEVGSAEQNPTLLISEAPRRVREGQPFRLVVSTRNLVRDRFLPAARGGYYLESSLLDEDGLVRGHFHTACRMLTSTSEAADPAPVPAFFVATEDGKGGEDPDSVIVEVPGLPAGLAQCSSWAGDGSHRIPMMVRANQIPALDSVRILVQPAPQEQPPAEEPGNEQPPAEQPGNEQPPAGEPGGQGPAGGNPGGGQPPAEEPGNEQPPAGNPGGQQPPAEQPGDDAPGQQPGRDDQPDDDQEPAGQKPTPQKPAGDAARPTTPATEPVAEESPEGGSNVAQAPPGGGNAETAGGGGGLALTGANTIAFVGVGVALLVAGAAFLFLSRRRRTVRR
ncbi:LPXTG cell wall anchor domain-containing protein [Plantactinospora sp. WMMB782]|uniref:LPXTG cell wall anchor domain-containing protein n=1 Tax=Plantactinospora sp. WMMB782 TaxID=3404121 RepID=UPI003B93916B